MSSISFHPNSKADSYFAALVRQFCHVPQKIHNKEHADFNIALRPFCIETDFPVFQGWLDKEYSSHLWQMNNTRQQLLKKYFYILQLNNARSFLALLDDTPVCFIEIYQAAKEEISLHYDAKPGDYGIRLLLSPGKKTDKELYTSLLQTCIEHLFNHPQAGKIILQLEEENEFESTLAIKAGFIFQGQINKPYEEVINLYHCTRESLEQKRIPL